MNLPATLSVSLFIEVVYGDDHPPCEKTIRSHCANGEIPGAFRAGRQWRIPAAAVYDLLGIPAEQRGPARHAA